MYLHDKPVPSRCLKTKPWKALRKPDFYINIHQSIPWTDKSPRLLLSLCFCSPQPFCFLCLLRCVWCSSLLLPNHLNTAKELQRGFALGGIHPPWTHSLQFSNLVFELLNLKQSQNYHVAERHLHSFPGQDKKAPAAPASESCSRCRSTSCFCCSAKAAAEACCACTLLWKRRKSKAQPNNSWIMFPCHIHNLAEMLRNKTDQTVRRICFQRWLVARIRLWNTQKKVQCHFPPGQNHSWSIKVVRIALHCCGVARVISKRDTSTPLITSSYLALITDLPKGWHSHDPHEAALGRFRKVSFSPPPSLFTSYVLFNSSTLSASPFTLFSLPAAIYILHWLF